MSCLDRLIQCAAAAGLLLALGACATSGSPKADERFGNATRELKAQQVADPGAPRRNAGAVPATDGRGVREAMDRSQEGARSPSLPQILLGTTSGSGSAGR